ncbi:glycine-rich domain-containing protein [Streptomyces sp. NBC_00691]|uniref:glycine-rich domain-containing protein n=1 Tax=Streptomyces sp. NBC_00691 TaxID=2903671 RepID=UPI002E352B57|nr:hypothetical protein [Streptomyces sp. NBC_00691]
MPIRIDAYTTKPDGTRTEPRTLYEGGGGPPMVTSAMPACTCPRCCLQRSAAKEELPMIIALEHPPIHYTEPRTLLSPEVWQALTTDVIKAHPGTDLALAERIIGQTIAFLIAGAMTDEPLSPSEHVDWGWHAFLLRTQAYQEFCDRHSGLFIHHHPGVPDATETGGPVAARDRTVAAIRAAGFEVDQELWPEAADCTQCHSGCTDSPVGGKK